MADDDNDLLTDEERAAMEADEGAEIDGSAALTDDEAEDWRKSGGWGAAEGDDPDDAPDAEREEDPDEQGEEEEPEHRAEPEQPAQREPETPRASTQEIDQQITSLRQQDEELLDQYDDGDLTREELAEKRRELQSQVDDLTSQRALEADRTEREMKEWKGAVGSYLDAYPGLKEGKVIEAFDAEVRAVTGSPAYASLSYEQQLGIAHKRLASTAEDLRLDVPQPKGRQKPEPQEQRGRRKAAEQTKTTDTQGDEMRTPPRTLAKVPASDVTGSDDGQYAALNRLMERGTPDEIEDALSKMSPEERDRFASANS